MNSVLRNFAVPVKSLGYHNLKRDYLSLYYKRWEDLCIVYKSFPHNKKDMLTLPKTSAIMRVRKGNETKSSESADGGESNG